MLAGVLDSVSSLSILEHESLQDDGEHLGNEHSAHDQEQEFGLEENRDRGQGAAKRQRASVAHEDFGGMRVVPEESYTRPHQGGTENRELAGPAQEIHVQVLTRVDASNHVGVERKRKSGDRRESGSESVQSVGDVDSVARPGHDEGDE